MVVGRILLVEDLGHTGYPRDVIVTRATDSRKAISNALRSALWGIRHHAAELQPRLGLRSFGPWPAADLKSLLLPQGIENNRFAVVRPWSSIGYDDRHAYCRFKVFLTDSRPCRHWGAAAVAESGHAIFGPRYRCGGVSGPGALCSVGFGARTWQSYRRHDRWSLTYRLGRC